MASTVSCADPQPRAAAALTAIDTRSQHLLLFCCEPSLINEDATGKGWLFRLKLANPSELDALMDEAAYQEFLKTLS